jgi:hypothetical protein
MPYDSGIAGTSVPGYRDEAGLERQSGKAASREMFHHH